MKKSQLRKIIKEEVSKVLSEEDNIRGATEDDPFYATQVGRNTGVRLNMRAVLKLLKDQGYPHSIHRGNLLFPIEILAGGRGRDVGAITITKNGELFGPGSWGMEVKSEEEVIPAIEQFVKDQQNK